MTNHYINKNPKLKFTKGNNSKNSWNIELWFLYNAFLLNVIYLYVKFEVTSFYTLEVKTWTKIQNQNLQRAITPKTLVLELWFLYNALLLNVTYHCVKVEVTSFNTFEAMPPTRFRYTQTDRQMGIKKTSPLNPEEVSEIIIGKEENVCKFFHNVV